MESNPRVDSASAPESCPVLKAWSKSASVMSQVCKAKKLLVLQHGKLDRATLVDNIELLSPLLNHIGSMPTTSLSRFGNLIHRSGHVYIPSFLRLATISACTGGVCSALLSGLQTDSHEDEAGFRTECWHMPARIYSMCM